MSDQRYRSVDGGTAQDGLPLSGLVVIDASTIVAGPLAAALLGDYGATVIKVEAPGAGDNGRRLGQMVDGVGSWWSYLSRHKKCVTCDLSSPDGAEIFRGLVRQADVVIENFRPGRLERWGLGPTELAEINAGLVLLRISGFGQTGPYADRPGYGTVVEALSGFADSTGFPDGPPVLPGIPVADSSTALMGTLAVMLGLYRREREGRGGAIDLPLYSSMLHAMGLSIAETQRYGTPRQRSGNTMGNVPRNAHQCADGLWVAYTGQSPKIINALVQFFDLGDDERFSDYTAAIANGQEIDRYVGDWISQRSRGEVVQTFVDLGIPIAPVNSVADVVTDHHFESQGDFVAVRDGDRTLKLPIRPFRLDGVVAPPDASIRTNPVIGQDNESVYRDLLGLNQDDLDRLAKIGAI